MAGPLAGVRVVELTVAQQGPVAGARLGDLGASVVKVESPGGDPFRGNMKMIEAQTGISGFNYYFEHTNRNKRGIAIDLKNPEGREAFLRLTDAADVFITNMKIDVPEKLGVGPDVLLARNPRLIYAHASGWGRFGDYAKNRAYDYTGIARAGLMYCAGEKDTPPAMFLPGCGDEMGAVMCAWGVTAALYSREKTGKGQVVDTSLLGSIISVIGMSLEPAGVHGKEYPRESRETANAVSNHYKCADGKWLALAHMDPEDKFWQPVCDAMGLPDEVRNDSRYNNIRGKYENARELVKIFDEYMARRPRGEWLEIFEKHGLIAAPVQTPLEVVHDPQALANRYIVDFEHPAEGTLRTVGFPWYFSETPAEIRREAPGLGEHTDEILAEAGYSESEIAALRAARAVI